jgi:hypothetical protein
MFTMIEFHRRAHLALALAIFLALPSPKPMLAQSTSEVFRGPEVRIGRGAAHTVVRANHGQLESISVVFTPGTLDRLPKAPKGGDPRFPYVLQMPSNGPKTVVNHVVIDWESAGHPPPHVYDVPHFDFHFYFIDSTTRENIAFKSAGESGDASQQPPGELLPTGYIVPAGTAVSKMGVHGVNPASHEFHKVPFTATFIYGYHNKDLIFIEPMASLAFLKSKPSFAAPIARPASYGKSGAYPSTYSIKYDPGSKLYEVMLSDFR